MQMLGSVSAAINTVHSSAVTRCLWAWGDTPKIPIIGASTKMFLIIAQGVQKSKRINDESYDRCQLPLFKDGCFCSGTHIHNTAGSIKSSSVALRITVHTCSRAHINILQESTISRTLSTKSYLLLTTLLDKHIPGLNGKLQGILVSPLIQVHKHPGRTLTIPFPKSAASSYQNLQDRSKQKAYIIKHKTVLYQKIPPCYWQLKIYRCIFYIQSERFQLF